MAAALVVVSLITRCAAMRAPSAPASAPGAAAAPVAAPSQGPIVQDACSLLTADDLLQVQGERFVETKPSDQGRFQQCFYRLPTFTKSVNLGIASDAREYWERTFREGAEGKKREEEGEREEELRRPRAISGVGDEAFWSPLSIGATLYVLQRDTVLRVAIGGNESDAVRLEKATALAKRALEKRHRSQAVR